MFGISDKNRALWQDGYLNVSGLKEQELFSFPSNFYVYIYCNILFRSFIHILLLSFILYSFTGGTKVNQRLFKLDQYNTI